MANDTIKIQNILFVLTIPQGNELGDDPGDDPNGDLFFRGEMDISLIWLTGFYKNVIGSSGIIFEICGVLIKFFSKSGLLGRKSAILFKFA